MDKSCLNCEYGGFLIYKDKGECEWELPSDSPAWLLEYPFGGLGTKRITKNRPYVDCP